MFTSLLRRPVVCLGRQPTSLPHFSCRVLSHLHSSVFNDFGPKFTVVDPTGEEPLTGMIVSVEKVHSVHFTLKACLDLVSQDKEGIVTCLDETRHGLEDGDFVTFREVQGMEELNGCEPRKVSVKGPYTFSIGDTTGLGEYKTGGIFTQVKMPKIIDFVSFWNLVGMGYSTDGHVETTQGLPGIPRVLHHRLRQIRSTRRPPRGFPSPLSVPGTT